MDDWDDVVANITASNASEWLAGRSCPQCGEARLETFHVPNNNGIGIKCGGCGKKHPLPRVMWLRQGKPKRSNDIAAVMEQRGHYCWGCGVPHEVLKKNKIGMHVHHTLPFAQHGEKREKIPLCALCHELLSAAQRDRQRQLLGVNLDSEGDFIES